MLVGAALFWSWGSLSFLSPSLLAFNDSANTHIELAFFLSQITLVCVVVVMLALLWKHRIAMSPSTVIVSGFVVSAATAAVAFAASVGGSNQGVMVMLGVMIGLFSPMLGIAWGARYSLEGPRTFSWTALGFLIAYGLYFAVSLLSTVWPLCSALVTVSMPACSALLWFSEARKRQMVTDAKWPTKPSEEPEAPSELLAGDTSIALLPWRYLSVLAAAALIGNLVPGILLESDYGNAGDICNGAFLISAIICTVAFFMTRESPHALSITRAYRMTLPFTAIGLAVFILFGHDMFGLGGALVMGGGLFLQVLVYIQMIESTCERGFSPLLTFGVGQAVIASVVFAGNVAGKVLFSLSPQAIGPALCIVSVVSLIAIITILAYLVDWRESREPRGAKEGEGDRNARLAHDSGTCDALKVGEGAGPVSGSKADEWESDVCSFAQRFELSPRETEVVGYLLRGRSVPYTAQEMFVTAGTVKTHVTHIYRKVGVSGRQQLIDLFEETGSETN